MYYFLYLNISLFSLLIILFLTNTKAEFEDSFDGISNIKLDMLHKRRGRELFGKRNSQSMERQSRRTRELFGKRSSVILPIETSEFPSFTAENEKEYTNYLINKIIRRTNEKNIPIENIMDLLNKMKMRELFEN
ncbi:hypothetical protein ACQ4LE_001768 [Meloidogyne hapla]|uniref:Uncharacterized protein n=1 Tax=Meloidogyne hapla TaxID=6305 RepID=A0A1I8AWA2_MELHA